MKLRAFFAAFFGAVAAHRERLLLTGAALALGGCFLRPEWPLQRQLFEHVVVLDITQSMNVADQRIAGKPASRLARAKQSLRQALLQLPCGSKVGLGVFTEYRSYLLLAPVEVCANLRELRASLDAIDGRMSWSGGSEVAKGLHSGLVTVKQLPGVPSLVFVTDGQEAPPLNAKHRPSFDDKRGEVQGLIVGVGDLKPSPIPKTDPQGRPLGVWRADEVAQTDPRSQGRGGSVGGEKLVEQGDDGGASAAALGATPGSEHLSALREGYLRLLAGERGLDYLSLPVEAASRDELAQALLNPAYARPVPAQADARLTLAALALVLLLARHLSWPVQWPKRWPKRWPWGSPQRRSARG